jgi:threonine synthase
MRYHSTRSAEGFKSFAEVLVSSYAADGGLYVPETLPAISAEKLASMVGYSFPQVCAEVMSWFTDIDLDTLRKMTTRAYSSFEPKDVLPIDRVGEVYHLDTSLGPTLSFKDVGQQMVAQVLNHVLGRQQRRATIVVETSGDTGPAAIAGVRGCDNIDIYCLYPHNRVSRVQELQMVTVLDANVHVYRTGESTSTRRH